MQDVIDELLQLFPSPYINMGGDEATKTYWKVCPLCQKRMQEEHLKEVEDLQGYFMGRLNDYIRSKGRILMGWDELTNSQLPEGAVILGWQGLGNAALKAADKGLDFVMTPARILYLIRYQGPQWFEPLTYFGNNTMRGYMIMNLCRQTGNRNMKTFAGGTGFHVDGILFYSSRCDLYGIPSSGRIGRGGMVAKGSQNWEHFQLGLDNYLAHLEKKEWFMPSRCIIFSIR